MPKEWKLQNYYNDLSVSKSEVAKDLLDLYKKGEWYISKDETFTLKSKFDTAKKTFIGEYGGSNAWTEQLFMLDLPMSKYPKDLKNRLKLNALISGKYEEGKCSDSVYGSHIKFIINNLYPEKKDIDDISWIISNNMEVFTKLMKKRIDDKRSISTFNSDLKMFARIMKIVFGTDHELYKKYSQLQTDMNRILIEKETGKNTLNRYEEGKFIDFEALLAVRNDLEKRWRDELEKNSIKSKGVWELHYKMLLLSGYTLTPCVRRELMETKFAISEEEMNAENDFVYVPMVEGVVEYNFQKWKKGKPSERYTVGWDEESRKKLSDLYRESYLLYKREWVFPQLKHIDKKSSVSNVSKILEHLIKGQRLGVNVIRSSYVTWRNKKGVDYNSMKEDAIRLRNSVETQMKDYLKLKTAGNNVNVEVIKKIEPNEIKIVDGVDALEKNKEYMKNYYQKNKDTIISNRKKYMDNNRNRINAMYHLIKIENTGKTPSDNMIKKWKLYKDTSTLKWHSEYVK